MAMHARLILVAVAVAAAWEQELDVSAACEAEECYTASDDTSLLQTATFVDARAPARSVKLPSAERGHVAPKTPSVERGQEVHKAAATLQTKSSNSVQTPSAEHDKALPKTELEVLLEVHKAPPVLQTKSLHSAQTLAERDKVQDAQIPDIGKVIADIGKKPKPRSTMQVLAVCIAVIGLTAAGWFAFWMIEARGEVRWSPARGKDVSTFKLMLLCLSFASCTWGMNIVNKSLVESLHTPTLVTAAQMLMSVIGTTIAVRGKFGSDEVPPQVWRSQVLKWSFIPFIFFGMLVSSFFTYKYLSLSMLMVIRNMGPIIILPIESMVMPKNMRPYVTLQMILALSMILGSTFLYCEGITVSLQGVSFALLNMVLAIIDRVAQRRLLTTECKDLSTETCVLLNNGIGVVPTMILSICLGEVVNMDVHKWFASMTTVLLLLSGFMGTGICYFALAVQREISATSFIVLQNTVRMAVVLFGVIVFMDPLGWPFQILGLLLSFAGAFWYGSAQLDGKTEKKAFDDAEKLKMAELDGQAQSPGAGQTAVGG